MYRYKSDAFLELVDVAGSYDDIRAFLSELATDA